MNFFKKYCTLVIVSILFFFVEACEFDFRYYGYNDAAKRIDEAVKLSNTQSIDQSLQSFNEALRIIQKISSNNDVKSAKLDSIVYFTKRLSEANIMASDKKHFLIKAINALSTVNKRKGKRVNLREIESDKEIAIAFEKVIDCIPSLRLTASMLIEVYKNSVRNYIGLIPASKDYEKFNLDSYSPQDNYVSYRLLGMRNFVNKVFQTELDDEQSGIFFDLLYQDLDQIKGNSLYALQDLLNQYFLPLSNFKNSLFEDIKSIDRCKDPYIIGKVIPIFKRKGKSYPYWDISRWHDSENDEKDFYSIDAMLFRSLDKEIQPKRLEDIGTVLLIKYSSEKFNYEVSPYGGSVSGNKIYGFRKIIHIQLFDIKLKKIICRHTFLGGIPPQSVSGGYSRNPVYAADARALHYNLYGDDPDNLSDYVNKLPRVNNHP